MDDDLDLRESLGVLLRALGREVREFSSADAFQSFFDGSQPGCLVLDISMPGRSGLELYADLIAAGHRIPVIFITAHADVSTAVAAMKTGAIEFLEKPFDRETISNRIDQALELDARWRTNEARFQALDERVRQLNKSDIETLGFLLAGAPNKAIATQLMISERAVELRRQRLMARLGVRNIAELLELTVTHRVLEEVREVATNWPHAL